MSGYARIHRSLLGHPVFRNDAEAMAFAWMIVRASWKPVRVRYKGRAVTLCRGQLALSIRDMADAMDRDKAWIERLFKRLRAETMIETVVEAGISIITICNYAKYQAEIEDAETVRETVAEIGARQRRDTEQRREKGNNIPSEAKASSGRRARARKPEPETIVVPDWVPSEQWEAFVAMRKRMGKPITAYAAARLVEQLAGFRDAGWSVAAILDKSIVNEWRGVFEPQAGRDDSMRVAEMRGIGPTTRAALEFIGDDGQYLRRVHGKRTPNQYYDRPSGWAAEPGMEGLEPVCIDDDDYLPAGRFLA